MRRLKLAAIVLPLLLSLVPALTAWGPKGHQIVARVAAQHLSPKARAGVAAILGLPPDASLTRLANELAAISNEADRIRASEPETGNWHFVDIPLKENRYNAARDCAEQPGRGDCIINALARERNNLKASAPAVRSRALTFVVHLVGDLHQPLHAADNGDRGGNNLKVKLLGKTSNLHRVWDSGIIELFDLSDEEYADFLLDLAGPAPSVAAMQKGDPVAWAEEAHRIARNNAYKIPRNKRLGDAYVDANGDVIDRQLLRAGLRLAAVLNAAF
jgi:hypothetical protein